MPPREALTLFALICIVNLELWRLMAERKRARILEQGAGYPRTKAAAQSRRVKQRVAKKRRREGSLRGQSRGPRQQTPRRKSFSPGCYGAALCFGAPFFALTSCPYFFLFSADRLAKVSR